MEKISEYEEDVTHVTEEYVFTQTDICERKSGTHYATLLKTSYRLTEYRDGMLLNEYTLAWYSGLFRKPIRDLNRNESL